MVNYLLLMGSLSGSIMSAVALITAIIVWKKKAEGGVESWLREVVGSDPEEIKIIKATLLCMLREDIRKLCDKCVDDGTVSSEELQSLMCMYDNYRVLKGNSFVHNLVARVKALPIRTEE